MTRGLLSALLAAAAGTAFAIALDGTPPAAATSSPGIYTITTCSPGTSPGGWTSINQSPGSLTTTNECGEMPAMGPDDAQTQTISTMGALFGYDQIGSTAPVPTGAMAGWALTAPAGVQITGITYYSSYETSDDGWLSGLVIDGKSQRSDCQTNILESSPCAVYNNQLPQVISGLAASNLFFGVECSQVEGAQTCLPSFANSHNAEAALYSAQVTLARTAGPTVQSEGGPLWGGGVVSGTVPVTFDATDPSGIQDVQVLSGTGVRIADQQQACTFTQVQACPELTSGQVLVDTSQLPDGPEVVQLLLANAAGDTTVARGPSVVIDNRGPGAPLQLSATAASSSSNVIDLAWANPATPPQPIASAYVELCQATCGSPVQVSTSGAAQITAPAAGSYTVRLWLIDSAGKGGQGSAATTTVSVPAATTQTVTTTTTTTTTTTVTTPVKVPTRASCKVCPGKKTPRCAKGRCVLVKVRWSRWSKGWLTLKLERFPTGDRLRVTLHYRHAKPRTLTVPVKHELARIKTGRPTRTVLAAVRNTKT